MNMFVVRLGYRRERGAIVAAFIVEDEAQWYAKRLNSVLSAKTELIYRVSEENWRMV